MAKPIESMFATLERPARIWAVAAVHGRDDKLIALHRALGDRLGPGDRLVYLGNFLGHGPDIVAATDELLAFRRDFLTIAGMEPQDIVFLRGAQEEMWWKLLQIQLATEPAQVFEWMMEQGVEATLRAYGGSAEDARVRFREGVLATTKWTNGLREQLRRHAGHETLLASLKRAAMTDGGELLFVHAGVDPHRPLVEQGDAFWWGGGYFADLTEPFAGFRRVVRGFDRAHPGIRLGPVTASIDGGCGSGGELIAACFDPAGEIIDSIAV